MIWCDIKNLLITHFDLYPFALDRKGKKMGMGWSWFFQWCFCSWLTPMIFHVSVYVMKFTHTQHRAQENSTHNFVLTPRAFSVQRRPDFGDWSSLCGSGVEKESNWTSGKWGCFLWSYPWSIRLLLVTPLPNKTATRNSAQSLFHGVIMLLLQYLRKETSRTWHWEFPNRQYELVWQLSTWQGNSLQRDST